MIDPGPLAALGIAEVPEVSLAHAGGGAIAVAAPPSRAAGIDMEPLGAADPATLAEGAFGPSEIATLGGADPDRLLIGWCAKEAVAKRLGQGLNGRPKSFVIAAFDGSNAVIETPDGARLDASLARTETAVIALSLGDTA